MSAKPRYRFSSLTTIVIVLILTIFIESQISFTLLFGVFNFQKNGVYQYLWLALRIGSVLAVGLFWWLKRNGPLQRAIVVANSLLTLGLATSVMNLIAVLSRNNNHINALALMGDVVLLALVNVLTFSIWYWLIDPPGIDESEPTSAPWEFLFPQRGSAIPGYEDWLPRYTDYLALAFYTSVAFSPTDVLPLTRRAKLLMAVQAAVSLTTITFIAGAAINILA